MWCVSMLAVFVAVWLKPSEEACYDFIQEQQKIIPPSHSNRKYFGNSVVLSNGYLIVGSKYDSENGFNSGAAHIYWNIDGEWKHQGKLIPSTGSAYGECGSTLAADGDTLLMGCPGDSSKGVNSGAVYVFSLDNTTWSETYLLKASHGEANAYFGSTLDIHKNTAVVNSYAGNIAYIFEYKSGKWQEVAKVRVLNESEPMKHGHSLAVSGNYLAIGHWYDNVKGHQSGSVNIFRNVSGNWTLETELRPRDGSHADWFGMSVAISNRFLVISSHGDDINGADGSGSAYVFENEQGQWKETKKLTPINNGTSGDSFGYPVVIDGSTIVIGCTGFDFNVHNSGGVHVFQRVNSTMWTETYKCLPSDGEYNGMFGYSIAVEDDTIVVGGVNHEDKTGSVYLFRRIDVTKNGSLLCDPLPPVEVEGVNLSLVLSLSILVGILVLILLVVCVYKIYNKFTIEKIQDNDYVYYQVVYRDVPKEKTPLS